MTDKPVTISVVFPPGTDPGTAEVLVRDALYDFQARRGASRTLVGDGSYSEITAAKNNRADIRAYVEKRYGGHSTDFRTDKYHDVIARCALAAQAKVNP